MLLWQTNTFSRPSDMAQTTTRERPRLAASVQGKIDFSSEILQLAASAAALQFQSASEAEFSGDAVESYALPAWLPPIDSWLPHGALLALGLERNTTSQPEMLGTCGIDPHLDSIHGLVFVVVIHNDGLKFKQARQIHQTGIREWFVFDDRLSHGVNDTKKSTCYLCITVPLRHTT